MKYLFIYISFISMSIFSQNIFFELDNDSIKMGERFNLKTTVFNNFSDTILWLKIDSLFEDFELLKSSEKIQFSDIDSHAYRSYLFTYFDTGKFLFPSTRIILHNDTLFTNSFALNVLSTPVDTLSDEIKDIKPQKEISFLFSELRYYWHYLLLAFFLLLLLIFILFVYVKAIQKAMTFTEYLFYLFEKYMAKTKEKEKIIYASDFLKQLNNIEGYFNSDIGDKYHQKELYVDLSECFRGYLEYRFDIPALESDSQDLKILLQKLQLRESWFNDFFRTCDLMKFAKAASLKRDSAKFLKMVRSFIKLHGDKVVEVQLLNNKNK